MLPSRLLSSAAVLAAALLVASVGFADDVLSGNDLFTTDPATTFQNFSATPIPAGFFDPGSDPFVDTIRFGGHPLGSDPHCPADNLSTVDTIVRRIGSASFPTLPATATVPIEIVALSLVSVSPITVTYSGGTNPEPWNVRVGLSSLAPQLSGSMTIRHTVPSGGTFDSTLPVTPRFTFTRVGDGAVRTLDLGAFPFAIQFQAFNVPWVHVDPLVGSCTSNFCVNPNQLTTELASLAAHGVISVCPQPPIPVAPEVWGGLKKRYR